MMLNFVPSLGTIIVPQFENLISFKKITKTQLLLLTYYLFPYTPYVTLPLMSKRYLLIAFYS